jgi:MtaA/CmuA family methyltransferase
MNPSERVRKRLGGEAVDRVPNFDIHMAFAAHFAARTLSDYYLDHRALVQANLAVQESFSVDVLQAISDPYREGCDFGLEVEFPQDGLPLRRRPLLSEHSDLVGLHPPDPRSGRRMTDRLEAVRLMKESAHGEIPVMGWVEGALALANVLRGDVALMTDLYDRPDWVRELLEVCVGVEVEFARAQVEAGADIIGLGDAIASQISPAMYREFALPYEQRIFAAVREAGAIGRLHICGDTRRLLPSMAETGAHIIDIDWMVDMKTAAAEFESRGIAVCGNFDPVRVLLRGSAEEVEAAVAQSLEKGGARMISAAGCEVPDGTPPENLLARLRPLG